MVCPVMEYRMGYDCHHFLPFIYAPRGALVDVSVAEPAWTVVGKAKELPPGADGGREFEIEVRELLSPSGPAEGSRVRVSGEPSGSLPRIFVVAGDELSGSTLVYETLPDEREAETALAKARLDYRVLGARMKP